MNDTLTPLPLLYLSAVPHFSLAEGQRPSRQPHIALSVKGQLSLQPPVQTSLGFLLCPREHIEGERESWKLKDEHLKEGQQKTGFTEKDKKDE